MIPALWEYETPDNIDEDDQKGGQINSLFTNDNILFFSIIHIAELELLNNALYKLLLILVFVS